MCDLKFSCASKLILEVPMCKWKEISGFTYELLLHEVECIVLIMLHVLKKTTYQARVPELKTQYSSIVIKCPSKPSNFSSLGL